MVSNHAATDVSDRPLHRLGRRPQAKGEGFEPPAGNPLRASNAAPSTGLGQPFMSADDGTRTRGLPADNRMLSPLSYAGMRTRDTTRTCTVLVLSQVPPANLGYPGRSGVTRDRTAET